jgi:hypothetical protein
MRELHASKRVRLVGSGVGLSGINYVDWCGVGCQMLYIRT